MKSWSALEVAVREGNMQVLVGTQVTCDEQDDDRDWRLVMKLLQVIGRERVMGALLRTYFVTACPRYCYWK